MCCGSLLLGGVSTHLPVEHVNHVALWLTLWIYVRQPGTHAVMADFGLTDFGQTDFGQFFVF